MMEITIAGRTLTVPILQGGMGVGVSLGRLAGSVAACGGMGTISTAGTGYDEPDFDTDPMGANMRALERHIRMAKELSHGAGMVAINAMVATVQYADSIRTAIKAGVDAIVSGAGLPLDLPALAEGANVALAPIVSGARAASLICRTWDKRYGKTPDFVVVEGIEAGGHLGFSREQAVNGTAPLLETLVSEVLEVLRPFCEKYGRSIPVFAAGGVFTGQDIARFTRLGAAGAQMSTRFIATPECDASQGYKDVILAARAEDVQIVQSPVGMPGRAVRTPLLERLAAGTKPITTRCMRCLTPCDPSTAPYCISRALIAAVQGNYEEGLFFCGSNVGRVNEMTDVKQLIDTLCSEWRAYA